MQTSSDLDAIVVVFGFLRIKLNHLCFRPTTTTSSEKELCESGLEKEP